MLKPKFYFSNPKAVNLALNIEVILLLGEAMILHFVVATSVYLLLFIPLKVMDRFCRLLLPVFCRRLLVAQSLGGAVGVRHSYFLLSRTGAFVLLCLVAAGRPGDTSVDFPGLG